MSVFSKDRRESWVGVGLSVSVTGIVLGVFWLGAFEWLELHAYDLRMQWRGSETIDAPVKLVLNDESTSNQLGIAPSRISRKVYGQAIKNLHRAGAAVIIMDVLFADSQSDVEDAFLETSLRQAGNVILARYIGSTGHRAPLKRFEQVALGQGLVNVTPDPDGVLRSVPLLGGQYDAGRLSPILTLGVEAVRQFEATAGTDALEFLSQDHVKVGSLTVPLVRGQVLVNFAGPSGTVSSLSLSQVAEGQFPYEQFKDQIVLVGSNAASLHDFYPIPFSQKEHQTVRGIQNTSQAAQMAGVEIHAHVIRTLLEGKGIERSSQQLVLILILLLGSLCCLAVILLPRGEIGVIVATCVLLLSVLSTALFLFMYHTYWLDIVPLLAVLNGHFALATAYQRYLVIRQKDHLRLMFSHFLPQKVIEGLWHQRALFFDGPRLLPRPLFLTVLQVRIRNMAEIIHCLDTETLLSWWSHYRGELTRELRSYDGLVSAWDDEGIRVYFGAPLPSDSPEAVTKDIQQAVSCAFNVLHTSKGLNEQWGEKGVPPLNVCAILYTGSGIGASIHDQAGAEYRVMGEAVEMSNRLEQWAWEGIDQENDGLVLAGESTVRKLDDTWNVTCRGDIKDWTENGRVQVYEIQKSISLPAHTES